MSMTATSGPRSSRPWAPLVSDFTRTLRLRAIETAYEAARRGVFERFATSRQARIGHKVLVGVERLLAFGRLYAMRGAVRQQFPALLIVLEVGHHDLLKHLLVHGGIEDR